MHRSVVLFLSGLLLSGCVPVRGIFLGYPDHKDIHRFPSATLETGTTPFNFEEDETSTVSGIRVNDWSSGAPVFVELEELLTSRPVRSMLIIRNDTVHYRFHGSNTDRNDLHPSYSMAKSFTSALIGIAIEEGAIGSVRDKVVDHIPELAGVEGADALRIEHLLNMTSGIRHRLKIDAQLYYGNDVFRAVKNVEFIHEPGTHQEYLNVNVQLLGILLKRATGMSPSAYLSEKIWKPLGMTRDGLWTTDRKGMELTFCCMGATADDYAKFGRLYLNDGKWKGRQTVPYDWVQRSLARDTTEGSSFGYNYLWHIGEAAYGDYMADGMYKQHIYVHPGKRIIIVLLNERDNKLKAERVRWRHLFRQVVDQL